MKKIAIITIVTFLPFYSYTQSYCGIEAGTSTTSFWALGKVDHEHFSAQKAPSIEFSYLGKVDQHLYWGVNLFFEQYSFIYAYTSTYSYDEEIKHKSNFILLAPTIDRGFGKRQHIHSYFIMATGFLVDGSQYTTLTNYNNSHLVSQEQYYSSNNIHKYILRFGFGLQELCPVKNSFLELTFNEGYSFMVDDLTYMDEMGYNAKALHPGYFYLQLGVRHKLKEKQKINPEIQKTQQ